jgi:quercetin dioxygenase-like cupin family protein
MKNEPITPAQVFDFSEGIDYAPGSVVSKTIIKTTGGTISLFAFAAGEGLSEHTAPFSALVQVIDGKAEITIAAKPYLLEAGQNIILPANVPHALKAVEAFKMVLTMIKNNSL